MQPTVIIVLLYVEVVGIAFPLIKRQTFLDQPTFYILSYSSFVFQVPREYDFLNIDKNIVGV